MAKFVPLSFVCPVEDISDRRVIVFFEVRGLRFGEMGDSHGYFVLAGASYQRWGKFSFCPVEALSNMDLLLLMGERGGHHHRFHIHGGFVGVVCRCLLLFV